MPVAISSYGTMAQLKSRSWFREAGHIASNQAIELPNAPDDQPASRTLQQRIIMNVVARNAERIVELRARIGRAAHSPNTRHTPVSNRVLLTADKMITDVTPCVDITGNGKLPTLTEWFISLRTLAHKQFRDANGRPPSPHLTVHANNDNAPTVIDLGDNDDSDNNVAAYNYTPHNSNTTSTPTTTTTIKNNSNLHTRQQQQSSTTATSGDETTNNTWVARRRRNTRPRATRRTRGTG